MERDMQMIHVRMPVGLIKQLDAYLEKHGTTKTDFIVRAVAERLRREVALESFRAMRGALAAEDAPEWIAGPAGEWVRGLRGREREAPVWPTS